MSIINPSSIYPAADSPVVDFKKEKKYLKIVASQRVADKDVVGLINDKPKQEISLGEIIAFETFGNKTDLINEISVSKLDTNKSKKTIRKHLLLFLYADAPKTSSKTISGIELKYYCRKINFEGKEVSLAEGLAFIKNYIMKSFRENEEDIFDYFLESDFNIFDKKTPLFLKDNFKNPTLSSFTRFEKEFLSDRNMKLRHFKSFYEKYDISKIRNLKKIVDANEILERMKTLNDNKFNV